jgi:hypothetical protein
MFGFDHRLHIVVACASRIQVSQNRPRVNNKATVLAPAGPKMLDDFWHFGTWVLVKIPLSFHYTGWFIGISRSWIISIPNILGSLI